jgi:hypothetical protein
MRSWLLSPSGLRVVVSLGLSVVILSVAALSVLTFRALQRRHRRRGVVPSDVDDARNHTPMPRLRDGLRYAWDVKTHRPFLVGADSQRILYNEAKAVEAVKRAAVVAEAARKTADRRSKRVRPPVVKPASVLTMVPKKEQQAK